MYSQQMCTWHTRVHRQKHSLLMHEGMSPPKWSACWIQKSSCLYTTFYIHIHWFSQSKHMHDNNFPEIINIFSSPFKHVFCCPGGLFGGPWWYLTAQWTGESWHNFPVLLPTEWALCSFIGQWFLKKKHCVTSPGAGNFSSGNSVSSLRSGFPEPSVCVSGAQLCASWLPAHLPSSLAVWPDAHQPSHTAKCSLACCSCRCSRGEDMMKWGQTRCQPGLNMTVSLSPSYPSL